jgi:hypothetical protein
MISLSYLLAYLITEKLPWLSVESIDALIHLKDNYWYSDEIRNLPEVIVQFGQ